MPDTPLTYYAELLDAQGNPMVGADGLAWVPVQAPVFSVATSLTTTATSSGVTGSGSGSTTTAFSLTLDAGSALVPGLLDLTAEGEHVTQVEVAGYAGRGSTASLAQDYVLETVDPASVSSTGSQVTVSLDFLKLGETTYQSVNGTDTAIASQSEDFETRKSVLVQGSNVTPTLPSMAPLAGVPAAEATPVLTTFVRFTDASGNVIAGAGGTTWFAATVAYTAASRPTVASADHTQTASAPPPVSITLAPSPALPALLADEISAGTLTVEVASYQGSGATATLATDTLFRGALVGTISTTGAGAATVSVAPLQLAERSYTSANGTTKVIGSGAGPTIAAPLAGTPAVAAAPALAEYVQIRNAAGQALVGADGATWFKVDSLALETVSTATITATGGLASGRPSLDPLVLSLGQGDALEPQLLAAFLKGSPTSTVEVAGYAASNGTTQLASDTLLHTVAVTSIGIGAGGEQTVTLNYGDLVEQSYAPSASGTPALVSSGGYNVLTGTTDTGAAATGAASLVAAPATPAPAGTTTFYAQFRTFGGGLLTGAGGATWFAVTPALTEQLVSNISSSGTGAGTGSNSGTLSLTLSPGAAATALFTDSAEGEPFASVQLAAYVNGAFSQSTTFTDAIIRSVASAGTGAETLGVDYGTLSASTVAGTLATPPATAPVTPLTYVVRILDASGQPLASATGATWFAPQTVQSAFAVTPVQAGTAGSTAKLTFTPLTLGLDGGNPLLPALLPLEAAGSPLTIEVAAYAGSGAGATLQQDTLFKGAEVTLLQQAANGQQVVQVQSPAEEVRIISNGTLTGTSSFDTSTVSLGGTTTGTGGTASSGASGAAMAPVVGLPATDPATGTLATFVRFTNPDGSILTDGNGNSWFAVTASTQSTEAVNGSAATTGGIAGKLAFGPLLLTFDAAGAPPLPPLLQDRVTSTPFLQVEVAGYAGAGSTAVLLQDSLYKMAAVQSVAGNADGTQSVTLAYGDLLTQSSVLSANGTALPDALGGQNVVSNTSDVSPQTGTSPVVPGGAAPPTGFPPTAAAGSGFTTVSGPAPVATTDEQPVLPFATTTVPVLDPALAETVTIATTYAGGVLSDPNQATDGSFVSNGTLTVSDDAADLTAAVRGLVFTPVAHQVAPGATVRTVVGAIVSIPGGDRSSFAAAITATAINDAPVIAGTVAGQATTDTAPIDPFATVTVTDPDLGVQDALRIVLGSPANGTLSGAGLTQAVAGSGTYTLALTDPATLTAELQALSFTPTAQQVAPGGTVTTTFALTAAQPAGGTVAFASDAVTSVVATASDETACFTTGTRILTARGEVAVEDLRVGDAVMALLGQELARVRWIGHRRLRPRAHPRPDLVQPVRILAGAFGEGRPCRDLRVSPGHALLVDGMLVPAELLVNGASVVQEDVDAVTYWHVELDRHDVLLADGLPAESYLDVGNRGAFENGGAVRTLHPEFPAVVHEAACAPALREGPGLAAIRERLLRRACTEMGFATTTDSGLALLADGRMVPTLAGDGERHRFVVPADGRVLRLCSRRWVPRQMLPQGDDTRLLGVCVRGLWIDGRQVDLACVAGQQGWHALEGDAGQGSWCWTNGDAVLPAGRVIELKLGGMMLAWMHAPASAAGGSRITMAASM